MRGYHYDTKAVSAAYITIEGSGTESLIVL